MFGVAGGAPSFLGAQAEAQATQSKAKPKCKQGVYVSQRQKCVFKVRSKARCGYPCESGLTENDCECPPTNGENGDDRAKKK
jgi:hypothetical protein